jgi:hypothetical protein
MDSPNIQEKPNSEKNTLDETVSSQIGVWEFTSLKDVGWSLKLPLADLKSGFVLFRRLALEIYFLAPGLLSLYILSKIWDGIEDALLLHLSSRLLQIVRRPTCPQQLILLTPYVTSD